MSNGGLARPLLTQAFGNTLINFKSSTFPSLALTRNRCYAEREGKGVAAAVVGDTVNAAERNTDTDLQNRRGKERRGRQNNREKECFPKGSESFRRPPL